MVLIERHLIYVTEDAPINEMADETSESGDSVTLNLLKGHIDMFSRYLACCIVKGLTEMLLRVCSWPVFNG